MRGKGCQLAPLSCKNIFLLIRIPLGKVYFNSGHINRNRFFIESPDLYALIVSKQL
jgi:hypothetical protein